MNNTINLWVSKAQQRQKKLLNTFGDWYHQQNRENPEGFPLERTPEHFSDIYMKWVEKYGGEVK